MSVLYSCFKVHFLNFFRNKGAFFWTLTFPAFFFVVFYSVFSSFNGSDYGTFLLLGVIGMTLIADGIFGIGQIVKEMYINGTIRILRKMPFNILVYFAGMILNRFLLLGILFVVLNILCFSITQNYIMPTQIPRVFLGILCGIWIFSFLGLSLSFWGISSNSEKSVANMVYFFILFTSNAFYDLSMFNEPMAKLAEYLPLNMVLNIMRDAPVNPVILMSWMIFPPLIFYQLFNKLQYMR